MRFSISKAMQFRFDFFFRIVMDCIYYAVNLAFYSVLYKHTTMMGGWRRDEIYLFVGGYLMIDAIQMTLFSNNIWWLPSYINKGELDHYLVKPVSTLFFVSLREFAANSFLNFLIALGYWIWAFNNYQGEVTLGATVLYVFLIINGALIYYLMNLIFVIPCFWSHSASGFMEISHQFHSFMERPHRIFKGAWRYVLLTAIPYGLMASMPADVFFKASQGVEFWIDKLNSSLGGLSKKQVIDFQLRGIKRSSIIDAKFFVNQNNSSHSFIICWF